MTTITVRAPDSVTALELVQQRFGADAMILSNLWIDGQVEITASDEMPSGEEAPQQQAPVDIVVKGPLPDPAQANEPVRLPSFLDRHAPKPFAKVLEAVKTPQPSAAPQANRDAPPALEDVPSLRDRLLSAPRIVLCGPVGAGKSQVALQLALMLFARAPQSGVDFFFCGTGSHSDGAFLARKSHLLGMETQFNRSNQLPPPAPGHAQIVVISGRGNDGEVQARQAQQGLPGARATLVLPAGLRSARLRDLRDCWGPFGATAILTAGEAAPLCTQERAELIDAGIIPLWTSAPERLVAGLAPTEPKPLPALETAEDAPALLFRRHTGQEMRS